MLSEGTTRKRWKWQEKRSIFNANECTRQNHKTTSRFLLPVQTAALMLRSVSAFLVNKCWISRKMRKWLHPMPRKQSNTMHLFINKLQTLEIYLQNEMQALMVHPRTEKYRCSNCHFLRSDCRIIARFAKTRKKALLILDLVHIIVLTSFTGIGRLDEFVIRP